MAEPNNIPEGNNMHTRKLSTILSTLLNRYMYSMGMIAYAFDPNDEADKAAVKAMIDEATAPLAAKNKELLSELKEARKSTTITPEMVEKLETQIDSLKAELSTAQGAAKKAAKDLETATQALATESGFTQKLLIDNGLSDVLVKAGVSNPAHLKAVKSMLQSQVQIVVDGDNRVAKVGDKALADFVGEWAKSDEGKHFVSAGGNSGGGAQGGSGGGTAKTMTRSAFNALPDMQKASVMKDGTTLTDG